MAKKIATDLREEARATARIGFDEAFYAEVDRIRDTHDVTSQDAHLIALQAMSNVLSKHLLYIEGYAERED